MSRAVLHHRLSAGVAQLIVGQIFHFQGTLHNRGVESRNRGISSIGSAGVWWSWYVRSDKLAGSRDVPHTRDFVFRVLPSRPNDRSTCSDPICICDRYMGNCLDATCYHFSMTATHSLWPQVILPNKSLERTPDEQGCFASPVVSGRRSAHRWAEQNIKCLW